MDFEFPWSKCNNLTMSHKHISNWLEMRHNTQQSHCYPSLSKNRSVSNSVFQLLEDFLISVRPYKLCFLFIQSLQWRDNRGKTLNKTPIVSGQTQKVSNIGRSYSSRITFYRIHIFRTYLNTFAWRHMTKEGYEPYPKVQNSHLLKFSYIGGI